MDQLAAYCTMRGIDTLYERDGLIRNVTVLDDAFVEYSLQRRKAEIDRMQKKKS